MIEVNKNTLASAIPALGKLVCRTSPLALYKSIKVDATEGKLRLSTCGVNEEVAFFIINFGSQSHSFFGAFIQNRIRFPSR